MIVTDREVLKQISIPTSFEEVDELRLLSHLKRAARLAWTPGVGLAAIQIGIPLMFAWYRWGEEDHFLINPEIIEDRGKMKIHTEGCLSIPDRWLPVMRPYKIKYRNSGVTCTAKGDRARIIMHEIDHMNGVLITDK